MVLKQEGRASRPAIARKLSSYPLHALKGANLNF